MAGLSSGTIYELLRPAIAIPAGISSNNSLRRCMTANSFAGWFPGQRFNGGGGENFFDQFHRVVDLAVKRAKVLPMRFEPERTFSNPLQRVHCADHVQHRGSG